MGHNFAVASTFRHRPMSFVRSRDQNGADLVLRIFATPTAAIITTTLNVPRAVLLSGLGHGRFGMTDATRDRHRRESGPDMTLTFVELNGVCSGTGEMLFRARTQERCICVRSPLAPRVGSLPDPALPEFRSAAVHLLAGRP